MQFTIYKICLKTKIQNLEIGKQYGKSWIYLNLELWVTITGIMNSDVNVGHVKIPSKYQELDVKAGKGDGEGSLCMCVSFYCNIKFTPDLSNLKPNSS